MFDVIPFLRALDHGFDISRFFYSSVVGYAKENAISHAQ